jgi:3-keto-5-aminohexanoate cleavage enzyme
LSESQPVIIEVALNGQTSPERNETVARSNAEVIEQGLACMDAGASIVHCHLLERAPTAVDAAKQYLECFGPWLDRDPDVLVMPTLGSGATIDEKLGHIDLLAEAGALRIGFIDPGTMILGYAEPDGTPSHNSFIYINTFADMSWAIDQAHRLGLALHFAIFEPGFLRNVFSYWRLGRLTPGSFVKFYFGGDNGYMARGRGVTFGLPPTEKALDAYLEMMSIEGCDLPWFSAVVGGDLFRTPIARATLERGGHLRVGLEDHLGDRQPSNLLLVQEMAALCGEVGRPVAGPAQAARLLGMPPRPAGSG